MALGIQCSADKAVDYGTTFTTEALNTTTGSTFLVFGLGSSNPSTPDLAGIQSVTDNKGNSYTRLGTYYDTYGFPAIFVCYNGTGGSGHTATLTQTNAGGIAGYLVEITGCAASPLDQLSDWTADTDSPWLSGTTGTTAQAAELILAAALLNPTTTDGTITWGNSFSDLNQQSAVATLGQWGLGYLIVSSTGTYQSSLTTTAATPSRCVTLVATFKEAGGSGTILSNWRPMQGGLVNMG